MILTSFLWLNCHIVVWLALSYRSEQEGEQQTTASTGDTRFKIRIARRKTGKTTAIRYQKEKGNIVCSDSRQRNVEIISKYSRPMAMHFNLFLNSNLNRVNILLLRLV